MNNNNINSNNETSIYHAPLIFDINAQRCYRRWGFVSNTKGLDKVVDDSSQDPTDVFHSPLVVDMNTQRMYRRDGFVSWP